MDTGLLVVILVVIILLALLAVFAGRQRRSRKLQDTFGPEYDRTVEQAGAGRPPRPTCRNGPSVAPSSTSSRSIRRSDPLHRGLAQHPGPVRRRAGPGHPAADRLITSVMRDRGYPVDDFEQRAADVSVDHPQVVDDYRAAHAIAAANDRSEASTEDLRQALVHYRSLFEELLEDRHRPVTDRGGAMTERHGSGDGEEGGRRPSGRGR